MTQLKTSPQHLGIGQRVRVLTGSCIGAVGVIANIEQGRTVRVRVRFDPPIRILAAGLIGSVWCTADGVEEVD
jgi:hypothetical protein